MTLQDELVTRGNLTLAYENASRGKRGRSPTAAFEYDLADRMLQLEKSD